MEKATREFYDKRGAVLVKNLQKHHFEAYYCSTKEEALQQILSLMPEGSSVGWGGAVSASQVGVQEAVHAGNYQVIDRDQFSDPAEKLRCMRECFNADFFITGANAISMDGQLVNIDGMGNRVAAMVYGPEHVIVIAGMNKVVDSLEDAYRRARTVAAPMNKQRFPMESPCRVTGVCGDCKSSGCICNQILVTRHCNPAGRIKIILVGEELGL